MKRKFGTSYKARFAWLCGPHSTYLTGSLPRRKLSPHLHAQWRAKSLHSSDPIIEPMLQTVPDPFDSYGPPPAEDKIFSILPPLSVIANTPSASPSPLTSTTPELESSSDGKNSWSNSAGGFFPETTAAWAEVTSSASSSMSPSASPLVSPSASPPAVNRRHSFPFMPASPQHSHRKSESKLRSVLSVIDESRSAQLNGESGSTTPVFRNASDPASATSGPAHPNGVNDHHSMESPWATRLLSEPPDRMPSGDDITPRNSMFNPAPTPPTPDTPSQNRSRSPQSDETTVPVS